MAACRNAGSVQLDDNALDGAVVRGQRAWLVDRTVCDGKADGEPVLAELGSLGRSNNSISPYLTYEDTFGSERWLGRSTLQGYWEHGPWRFMPSATVGYIEDKTEAYTNSLGVAIPSAKSTLGQLKFGPEASYRFMNASGDTIEPRAKLEAIWNFTHSSIGYTELDAVSGTDEWRGRVEVGLRLQTRIGQILDFSTAYDGIGSGSYSAVSGTATLRFPLN